MTRRIRVVAAMVVGAFLAVAVLMGAGRLLASTLAENDVPKIVNYQGYLTDGSGPVSGTVSIEFRIFDASSGGSQIWSETHPTVTVSNGYFSVYLGSAGSPLTPSVFSNSSRYLEVEYNGTTFARQRFASVPYALVAQQATEAITSTYAMTAAYAMNAPSSSSGVDWQYVKIVAKSGGDYTSISDAMSAITPTSSSRYLVLVMPGTYVEQVTVKEYVHLKGAGVASTIISSTANTNNVNDDEAATMIVPANAQVSDLMVVNAATTQDSSGIKIKTPNGYTILNNVHVKVTTSGGDNHRGIYLTGGLDNPKLTHVYVEVSGGSAQNLGAFNSAVSPIVHDSTFMATGGTSAVGYRMNGGNPVFTDSKLQGTNGSNGQGMNTSGAGSHTVTIDRSSLIGDSGSGSSVASTDNYDFFVGASLLDGDIDVFGTADITCAQSYDGNYADVTCP